MNAIAAQITIKLISIVHVRWYRYLCMQVKYNIDFAYHHSVSIMTSWFIFRYIECTTTTHTHMCTRCIKYGNDAIWKTVSYRFGLYSKHDRPIDAPFIIHTTESTFWILSISHMWCAPSIRNFNAKTFTIQFNFDFCRIITWWVVILSCGKLLSPTHSPCIVFVHCFGSLILSIVYVSCEVWHLIVGNKKFWFHMNYVHISLINGGRAQRFSDQVRWKMLAALHLRCFSHKKVHFKKPFGNITPNVVIHVSNLVFTDQVSHCFCLLNWQRIVLLTTLEWKMRPKIHAH